MLTRSKYILKGRIDYYLCSNEPGNGATIINIPQTHLNAMKEDKIKL